MRGYFLITLFFIVLLAQAIHADEITLTNGDRLTGKIDHALDGKLVFTSDLAGKVTVELSKIQTFSTDEAIEIHLEDGNILMQKAANSTAGKFAVEGTETVKAQDFDVAVISSINPPPKPKPKWTGNVSAAVTSTHGNTKTEAISASANLSLRNSIIRQLDGGHITICNLSGSHVTCGNLRRRDTEVSQLGCGNVAV